MKKHFFNLLALAGLLAANVSPALAADKLDITNMRTISVSGRKEQQFSPDQAVLNVTVASRDVKLAAAKSKNDALANKLVEITDGFKIPHDKVATTGVFVSPEYSYENNRQRLIGYMANRSYRITMNTLDTHEKLMSALVEAGIDQIGGVEFQLADPEKYAMELRTQAFANAKAKADSLAKAAGATLGPVISISTEGQYTPMPMMPRMAKMALAEAAPSSVAPTLPGLLTMTESVSVVFALE